MGVDVDFFLKITKGKRQQMGFGVISMMRLFMFQQGRIEKE